MLTRPCKFLVKLQKCGNRCLFYHDMLTRIDGADWGEFPPCNKELCPIENTKLWESIALMKTTPNISCNN